MLRYFLRIKMHQISKTEFLSRFQCRQCGECCRQAGFVYLRPGEAETVADYLQIDLYAFTDRYCEVLDRQKLVLKKLPDETCVFYRQRECAIHPAKPKQCRDFPHQWDTPRSRDYCEGIKKRHA
ncbi:MAG: YkgJ family cysteine cluster protein [Candidatus Omnitrophota bacterium]